MRINKDDGAKIRHSRYGRTRPRYQARKVGNQRDRVALHQADIAMSIQKLAWQYAKLFEASGNYSYAKAGLEAYADYLVHIGKHSEFCALPVKDKSGPFIRVIPMKRTKFTSPKFGRDRSPGEVADKLDDEKTLEQGPAALVQKPKIDAEAEMLLRIAGQAASQAIFNEPCQKL